MEPTELVGSCLQPGSSANLGPKVLGPKYLGGWPGREQGHGLVGSRGLGKARATSSLSYAILLHRKSKGSSFITCTSLEDLGFLWSWALEQ